MLILVCLLTQRPAFSAGIALVDGFESGSVNAPWSKDGARNMCSVTWRALDGGTPHSGNSMLICNWNGTVPWDDPNAYTTLVLPQSTWRYQSEFFIRLWLRYDQDVTHSYGGKVLRLDPNDKLDSFYIIAQMNSPGGPAQCVWELLNGAQGPSYWGAQTSLGDHSWHKVEIYVRASAQHDGIARVWIDGSLRQEVTNAVTVTAGRSWGPLYLMSNWSNNPGWDHGANNHVYWDDIEVYTDMANGASGRMSDASISGGIVPGAPTAVAVH